MFVSLVNRPGPRVIVVKIKFPAATGLADLT
jgi:hypothetical protein